MFLETFRFFKYVLEDVLDTSSKRTVNLCLHILHILVRIRYLRFSSLAAKRMEINGMGGARAFAKSQNSS